jgi:hypothetical protein
LDDLNGNYHKKDEAIQGSKGVVVKEDSTLQQLLLSEKIGHENGISLAVKICVLENSIYFLAHELYVGFYFCLCRNK